MTLEERMKLYILIRCLGKDCKVPHSPFLQKVQSDNLTMFNKYFEFKKGHNFNTVYDFIKKNELTYENVEDFFGNLCFSCPCEYGFDNDFSGMCCGIFNCSQCQYNTLMLIKKYYVDKENRND